jgi:hypothetical protein
MEVIKGTPPSSNVIDMTTPEATTFGGVMDEVTARKLSNQVRRADVAKNSKSGRYIGTAELLHSAKLKAQRDLWLQDNSVQPTPDPAGKAEELISQDAKARGLLDRGPDGLQGDDLRAAQQAHEQYRRSVYEELGLDPDTGQAPSGPRDDQSGRMSPEDLRKASRHYQEAAQRASNPRSRKIFSRMAERFRTRAQSSGIRGNPGSDGFMANSKGVLPPPTSAY